MTILQRVVTLVATALIPSSLAAQWVVSQSASKVDDSQVVTATVTAKTDPNGAGLGPQPTLSIRCHEGSLDVTVKSGTWSRATRLRDRSVRYRVDGGAPADEDWSVSPSSDVLLASHPRELIASMLKGKLLRLEYSTYNGDLGIVDFPIDVAILGKIQAACPDKH